MPKIHPFIILVLLTFCSCSVKRLATNIPSANGVSGIQGAYIDKYKNMAISEMRRSGVPASITLAQGMLESDYGRSRLAVMANNHFGIKCGSGWQGATITHDDDRSDECFRRYRSVEESYYDHSNFLTSSQRYRDLFNLNPEDYKGWARGLKQAGYATNPSYADLLINKIEEYELWRYDRGYTSRVSGTAVSAGTRNANQFAVSERMLRVKENNRIKYIIVNETDTRESIEKDFNILRGKLSKYNELDDNFRLQQGQILYLQPKRNKAEVGKNTHSVISGDSMYSISQKYGIKLKKLYEMNRMREGEIPKAGDRIWLRRMKPIR